MPIQPQYRPLAFLADRTPVDLLFVVAVGATTALAVLRGWPSVVRLPLALFAVLFLPGYALTVALFPAGKSAIGTARRTSSPTGGITVLERAVISVGLSLAIVPLVALLVNYAVGILTEMTILGGVLAVTLLALPVAYVRRRGEPRVARFEPGRTWWREHTDGSRRLPRPDLATIMLALSVVFAGGAVAYSSNVADHGGSLTEFYFAGDDGDEHVAPDDYPTSFTQGEPGPVSLAIANHEGEPVNYTVVGQLQRIDRSDGTLTVQNRTRVYRGRHRVGPGEVWTVDDTVSPRGNGTYRLVYLLYDGDARAPHRIDGAYREVHLWIDVSAPATTSTP